MEDSWIDETYSLLGVNNYSRQITGFEIDKNNVKWISTLEGLVMYDGSYRYKYTTADGICSNSIYSFYIDNKGKKWIGTEDGISILYDKSKVASINNTSPKINYEPSRKKNILVNPTAARNYINTKPFYENANFSIYNSNGQKVKQGILQGNTIDVSSLANGYYELVIGNSCGGFMVVR